jgi:catechol 2,3-dioxygenase-like lactoylglutathione lyase family enzyme
MNINPISIRPFIGAKDFEVSRNFYRDFGFEEKVLFHNMSYFSMDDFGFYLQDAYVKDWIDNTMVFLQVEDVEKYWEELQTLSLPEKHPGVRLTPPKTESWGKECFIHDPSGVLWHVGQFF